MQSFSSVPCHPSANTDVGRWSFPYPDHYHREKENKQTISQVNPSAVGSKSNKVGPSKTYAITH